METGPLFQTVPKGKNILRGKFVFDDKRDDTGKVVRLKARFVAMGYTQRYGEDYFETYAKCRGDKKFTDHVVCSGTRTLPILWNHWGR